MGNDIDTTVCTQYKEKLIVNHDKPLQSNSYIYEGVLYQNDTCNTVAVKEFCKSTLLSTRLYHNTLCKDKPELHYYTLWDLALNEIKIHSSLQHPCICKILYIRNADKSNNYITHIALEYCSFGSILQWNYLTYTFSLPKQYLSSTDNSSIFTVSDSTIFFSETFLWYILRSLAHALLYIHSQNIFHGDIKPQNILLCKDFTIRLCDFGAAQRVVNNDFSNIFIDRQTAQFIAPESCIPNVISNPYILDIWALGITMYCIAFLQLPFDISSSGNRIIDIINCITHKDLIFPSNRILSSKFLDIIDRLLCKDPTKRITLLQLIEFVS